MWFTLAFASMLLLVARRSTEKHLASTYSGVSLAWLQQILALPFILLAALLFTFVTPSQVSGHFWVLLSIYTLMNVGDLVAYFIALKIADISYVAPLLSLVAVGNMLGAWAILGQRPSAVGFIGGLLIVFGAGVIHIAKTKHFSTNKQRQRAFFVA